VRVRDSYVPQHMDASDAAFTVQAPTTGAGGLPSAAAFFVSGRNPARGAVHFRLDVPQPSNVEIVVYDVGGRLVKHLASGKLAAGSRDLTWDLKNENGRTSGFGIYFVRAHIGSFIATSKVIVI